MSTLDPTKVKDISLDMIDDPAEPMRSQFNEHNLEELADSIKKIGLIQPITLRIVNNRYEVVAGHRRLKAAKLAGMVAIPAVVKDIDDVKADDLKIHENLFREDVNPVDEARFIVSLIDKYGYTLSDMALKVNKPRKYLKARYDLLQYPEYLIAAVEEERVGLGAASWLSKIRDERVLSEYVRFAIGGGITARRAEAWYRSWEAGHLPKRAEDFQDVPMEPLGEPEPLMMRCIVCDTLADIDEMEMYYAHADCVRALEEAHASGAIAPPTEPEQDSEPREACERSEQ